MSPSCLIPESELLITTYAQGHPAIQRAFELGCLFPVHGLSLPSHSTACITALLTPSTFCLAVLPVRIRTGRLRTPAKVEGSRKNRHISSGLADPRLLQPMKANCLAQWRRVGRTLVFSAFPVGRGQCTRLESCMCLIAGGPGGWED